MNKIDIMELNNVAGAGLVYADDEPELGMAPLPFPKKKAMAPLPFPKKKLMAPLPFPQDRR